MTAGLGWSPDAHARHAGPRLRPALDLLARVPLDPATVTGLVDLGCGAGALFPALRARFPEARVTGVDLSPEMLRRARAADPKVRLVEADFRDWRPPRPVDLIVANAVLHCIPIQRRLLPELLRACRVLAFQVPDNFHAPSHRLVEELMREPAWRDRLGYVRLGDCVLTPWRYREILVEAGAATVEMWQTTYFHELTGEDPVLGWLRGTTLLPVHAALGGPASAAVGRFENELGERLRRAYVPSADGVTLFPFQRLFLVARAADGG